MRPKTNQPSRQRSGKNGKINNYLFEIKLLRLTSLNGMLIVLSLLVGLMLVSQANSITEPVLDF